MEIFGVRSVEEKCPTVSELLKIIVAFQKCK